MSEPAKPEAKPRVARLFAKPTLGWASIVMVILMLLLFAFTLFHVVPHLTEAPTFARDYLEKAKGVDAPFLVALEYDSFAIRTQGIQIALGFLVGILMGAFGLVLFAIGATDAIDFDGTFKEGKLSLKSTAPGLVVMIMSGVVIAFSVTKEVRRGFDATYKEGKDAVIEPDTPEPVPETKVSRTKRKHGP